MRLQTLVIVVLAVGIGLGSGCRKRNDTESSTETADQITIDQILSDIDSVKKTEGHDAAVALMKDMIKSDDYHFFKVNIAEMLINECLEEDNVVVAQNVYLQMAAADESIARSGFTIVARASTTTNVADIIDWYEKILVAPVSPAMKSHTWMMLVKAHAGDESLNVLLDRLDEILELSGSGASAGVLNSMVSVGLGMPDYDGLELLIAAVRERAADRQDLMQLMLVTEGNVLLQQGNLKGAEEFIAANAAEMGDVAVRKMSLELLKRCIQEKNSAVAEALVASIYAAGGEYPTARNAVAALWIRNAVDDKNPEIFLNRVNKAIDLGCDAASLLSGFRQGFYMVMMSGNSDLQKKCIALNEKLNAVAGLSDSLHESLLLLSLDGAFYRNDFKYAYKIIENGIPGHDEEWHIEMKDKVGAHLALQEGRKSDAIELFRKHMARVEAWAEPVMNPTNGAMMTREAVLGFNEKRIGDIYAGMEGHTEDAKAAYSRARDWYNKAIAAAKPGSIEQKIAKEELALVPQS